MKKESPSIDKWLKEAKADPAALQEGMFLIHNGVVRQTPKAKVRQGIDDGSMVKGLEFAYDTAKVDAAVAETYKMDGIFYVRVWLNEGRLELGDDIMYVLIGGDIRPHVVDALQFLVGKIKNECVTEIELRVVEHMNDCLLCASKIIYFNEPKEMECVLCHGKFFSNVQCEHGHYICDECHSGNGIKLILEVCRTTISTDPIEIMQKLMAQPCFHMHGPEHHIMVGAALLAAYHNSGGNVDLDKALTEIERRGKQVPGGACGYWGSCGAAISAGMYISIVTGSTPLSKEAWSLSNRMTSAALKEISQVGGPRCCKRNSFTAATSAMNFTQRYLSVNMKRVAEINCSFSEYNHECLGAICPYNCNDNHRKV